MTGVDFLGNGRKQAQQRLLHVADQTKVKWAAIAQGLRAHIDLRDPGVLGEELTVRKIRTQQQQCVAVLHGSVAGREADEPRHANVVRIVVLNKFLATQCMNDRRFQTSGKLDDFVMRSCTARTAEEGDAGRALQQIGQSLEILQ
jgi:hypothetical protein